jgi:hypothetical protein
MSTNASRLFPLGQLVATPGALAALTASGQNPAELLARHQTGDYGCVCEEDKRLNDQAVKDGSRVFSAYLLKDGVTRVWVITEAGRTSTCFLLPAEY